MGEEEDEDIVGHSGEAKAFVPDARGSGSSLQSGEIVTTGQEGEVFNTLRGQGLGSGRWEAEGPVTWQGAQPCWPSGAPRGVQDPAPVSPPSASHALPPTHTGSGREGRARSHRHSTASQGWSFLCPPLSCSWRQRSVSQHTAAAASPPPAPRHLPARLCGLPSPCAPGFSDRVGTGKKQVDNQFPVV